MIMEIAKNIGWILALGVYITICHKIHMKLFGELHLEEIEHHLTPDNLPPIQIISHHNRCSKLNKINKTKNINKNYMRRT